MRTVRLLYTYHRILFALSVFLSALVLITSCGLPNYPYLYPPYPPPKSPLDIGDVGFVHNQDNDPFVFQSYYIYYKFYKTNPSDGDTAKLDKNRYFNSSADFNSVSYNQEGTDAYKNGFRTIIFDEGDPNRSDHLEIDDDEKDDSFTVKIIQVQDNRIILTLSDYLSGSEEHELYRIVEESGNYKEFYPFDETVYDTADTDIAHLDSIDSQDELHVAFFAVIYGRDEGISIFANNNSSDMIYIGSIQIK